MEANHDDYNSIMEDSRNMIMIKGKRTKRPRPSSPLALTMASTSSTTTTTATTTTGATSHDDQDGDHTNNINPNYAFLHIPTTNNSIEFTRILQEHDDDQDMANCLILLAQGQSSNSASPPPPNKVGAGAEVQGARTSGFYVYECKTCNRGFSSFQALGGHRASHKKPPKPTVEDKIKWNIVKREVGVDHHTTLSLQIGSNPQTRSNPSSGGSIKAAKVHECSICGAEFGSGQALGGHMRRHRSMPMATTTCSNNSSHGCYQESKKPKTLLSLDLNLPAPVEDDHRETKLIPFRSKDQMIVFSNSSLVHCHL